MVEITALFCYNKHMETKEKDLQELQALLEKTENENAALRRQVDWLSQQLRLMQGHRFGASSEKTQTILEAMDQVSLFDGAEAEADEEKPEPELDQVTYRRRKQKGKRELAHVPAQYKVVEHVQTAYSCRHCERTGDHVPMKKSGVPAPLIPNSGVASPSLLAHIMNSKYTPCPAPVPAGAGTGPEWACHLPADHGELDHLCP